LKCYKQAQIDALTEENYKAGWKASGLWPLNISKPLINRLLLENSNKAAEEPLQPSRKDVVPEWIQDSSFRVWKTPQKSKDVQEQSRQITRLKQTDTTTTRVLFKKIAKGLDNKDFIIAKQEHKIQALKARVVQLEPRKRRKVRTSPNSKFANIEKIYKAQMKARDRQNIPLNSDDFPSIASTLSHISIN
jgi:4-hydroxybenzoate polyprenyltransferase